MGLVATNTIAQGDTREASLDKLLANDFCIYRTHPDMPWPGTANLHVAVVWLAKHKWEGSSYINDFTVSRIDAYLSEASGVVGKPCKFAANGSIAFSGSYIMGDGFLVEPEKAKFLSIAIRDIRECCSRI